jgi:hypothetical protein
VGAESGCFRILRECLVSSMRLGVPFIAPRQLGAVGDQLGRPILPSVEWCTRQSGAPPDNYCSCLVLDFFPYGEQPIVGPWNRLAHRTLSGAHWTVRCAQPTVGTTTCRAKIGRPTCDTPIFRKEVKLPFLFSFMFCGIGVWSFRRHSSGKQ